MTTPPSAFLSLEDKEYRKAYGASLLKYDVALAIVEARTKKGLSQREMAESCGVSQPYIARLESGEANPTIAQLASLLASVGVRLVVAVADLETEESRREKLLKALTDTAGILSDKDYPDWSTPEKVAEWVHNLRRESSPREEWLRKHWYPKPDTTENTLP
ncbi:MAG: helix-turn-helix transcriptional regulator [Chloroflexi bacterium]|nr:helix-turn-helix transcriptional regulator [Chloroflexota bacterium]